MSHVTIVSVQFKDLEVLKEICQSLGLEFRQDQKSYRWYGRHVGDFPLPEGFTRQDLGKCDHAIGVSGNPNAYEVGLVRRGDAFIPVWDFWNGGYGLVEKVGEGCDKLVNAYAKAVARRHAQQFARANGWTVTENYVEETQETVLLLRKY